MKRSRIIWAAIGGLFVAIVLFLFGRVALRHYGKTHHRFQYGTESYHRDFAAACDTLLWKYGTNARATLFSEPPCLFPLSETNFVSDGETFVAMPIGKADVPRIITDLKPVLVVIGDKLVGISLYRPARGGYHIAWSRRQWSEDRNSLTYHWGDAEGSTVYREQTTQRNDQPDGPSNGSQPICPETNRTSSSTDSSR